MRPLRIRLVNFGPYRDQTIDFEAFNEAPLFLISGKTGAGKTTIFDAMCFALFGRSSGGDRDPAQMRSDFATPTEETAVTFIFEHQGEQYVIVRKPAQVLAKKRGTGTTTQNASVELTVTDRNGQEKAWTKVGPVRDKLTDLLHLTPEQFTQIVLLPQGQFRHFLEANSNEKQKLLADLFSTDLYARWAAELADRLKAMKQTVQGQTSQLAAYAKMIQWQADEHPDETAPLADVLQALTTQNEQMTAELTERQHHHDDETTKLTKLENQVKAAETLLAVFKQRDDALAAKAELTAQAPKMAALAAQITELGWASEVQPLLVAKEATADQLTKTSATLAETTAASKTATVTLEAATTALMAHVAKAPEEQQRQQELTTLTQQRPLFKQVATLTEMVTEQRKRVAKDEAAVAALKQAQVATTTTIQTATTQVEKLGNLEAAQLALRDHAHALTTIQKQRTDLQQLQETVTQTTNRIAEVKATLATATAEQAQAIAAYETVDREWTVAQIQRLSAKLVPGEPCPVCGAVDHPQVAPVATATVVEEDVKAADARRQQASATVERLTGQLRTLTDELAGHVTACETAQTAWLAAVSTVTDESLVELATADEAVAEQVNQQAANEAALADQLEQRTQLTQTLSTATVTQTDQTAQQKKLVETLHADQTTLATVSAQLTERQHGLPTEYVDLAALDAHLEAVQNASATFKATEAQLRDQQATARDAHTRLATQVQNLTTDRDQQTVARDDAERVLNDALTAHDATLPQLQTLLTMLPQLAGLREQEQQYAEQVAKVTGQLETLEAQIGSQKRPNVAELVAARDAQQAVQQTVQAAFYEYRQLVNSNVELADKLATGMGETKAAQTTLAQLTELSDTANGKNHLNLSLERYILQTYLQKVLEVANVRLAALTSNRHQFQLDTAVGSRTTDTGLEINVFDDQAGKSRSVHTLSGGESFIAALSLALALGEVIQNEAGGISIEALFVDEGFGSLDEEALQMAMEALQSIEGRNRMIGIISHVTEMQEQIPDQLRVVSQANGQTNVSYQHEL
ncbi:AAA family ATPase [Furfurilactobacillus sp. WILCCON 0119]